MSKINVNPAFKLIGHRGAAGIAEENTLASFITAAKQGLDWIEFDIQLTKDNYWVVIHDTDIDRTTTRSGQVSKLTLQEIKQIDTGKIPSLAEALNIAQQYKLNLNIEVKNSAANPEQHVNLLLASLLELKDIYTGIIIISSFELQFLDLLRQKNPNIPISYIIKNFARNTIEIARKNNFSSINCYFDNLKLTDLQAAKKYNIPVLVYTINDPQIAKYYLDLGVTAIFTDRPDLLKYNC